MRLVISSFHFPPFTNSLFSSSLLYTSSILLLLSVLHPYLFVCSSSIPPSHVPLLILLFPFLSSVLPSPLLFVTPSLCSSHISLFLLSSSSPFSHVTNSHLISYLICCSFSPFCYSFIVIFLCSLAFISPDDHLFSFLSFSPFFHSPFFS